MRRVATVLLSLLGARTALCLVPPSIKLNNGVEMPLLSFGANIYPEKTCKQATLWAIEAGFRFIWSSEIIGEPCQRAQRAAIDESGVPRAEIFLAGTVNSQDCTSLEDCYQQTKASAEKQFVVLSSGKLDMLMLDYPSSFGCDGIKGQWKAFEELYAAKRVRSIAVSNFGTEELQCVSSQGATVPAANQLRFNVGYGRRDLVAEHQRLGVALQAYSPLGTGRVLTDPLLAEISQAHGKSTAQVALKWLVSQGVAVNLASTNKEHLREDTELFDFELSAGEMARLNANVPAAPGTMSKVEVLNHSVAPVPGPKHLKLLQGGSLLAASALVLTLVVLARRRRSTGTALREEWEAYE